MQNLNNSLLTQLEQQLDIVLTKIQQLTRENQLLRQQLSRLLQDNAGLTAKNRTAQQHLTQLITRLKMEHCQ